MVCRPTHRRLHPKRNHREMGRTIAWRLICTLHLAEKSIPRFRIGHPGDATDRHRVVRSWHNPDMPAGPTTSGVEGRTAMPFKRADFRV